MRIGSGSADTEPLNSMARVKVTKPYKSRRPIYY